MDVVRSDYAMVVKCNAMNDAESRMMTASVVFSYVLRKPQQ